MSDPILSSVQADVTKVEATVKTDVASVESRLAKLESAIKTDLTKTYSAKIVALAFAAGLVVGFILKALV